jgi:hypothetical protein
MYFAKNGRFRMKESRSTSFLERRIEARSDLTHHHLIPSQDSGTSFSYFSGHQVMKLEEAIRDAASKRNAPC